VDLGQIKVGPEMAGVGKGATVKMMLEVSVQLLD
jgi:hypothetical protein